MRNIFLYIGALSCLFLGCTSNSAATSTTDNTSDNPTDESKDKFVNDSDVTLYYDISQTVKLDMKDGGAGVTVESNDCVEILTKSPVTDANGIVTLEIQAKKTDCTEGQTVKVCVDNSDETAQEDKNCAEFTVHTTADTDEIDKNKNLMIDAYETNTDKDKYTEEMYHPGDCSSYCHDNNDCEEFCDSAIGYRCSKRCTSDEQCIKVQDAEGNWESLKCREDGRCAYPSFKFVYNITKDNVTVTMGGQTDDKGATIDWGDDTKETIEISDDGSYSHTYKKKGKYTVEITGYYRNWSSGCSKGKGIDVSDVLQFGPVGIGYSKDTKNYGSFWNCFGFNKISAKDIPDSTLMTDMSGMFGGEDVGIAFNSPAIARWDTSNVTSMLDTFCNAGDYNKRIGFNQDITRWDTSKVTTMDSMFFTAYYFNQPIGCWDVSNVENISKMFTYNIKFNQDLSSWHFNNVPDHRCTIRWENGHNGDISLKNYCKFRSAVNNENIGRDGDAVNGDCPEMKPFKDPKYNSTCCGIQGYLNVDRNKYDVLCYPGYNYGPACDGMIVDGKEYNWETVVHDCIEKYFKYQDEYKHLTEDTVTCYHLRVCTMAYYMCQLCHEGDPKCPSRMCADYPNNRSSCSGGGPQCPDGRDTFCNADEVFDSYSDTAYSCNKNVHVCYPCQHLDWGN